MQHKPRDSRYGVALLAVAWLVFLLIMLGRLK